MKFLKSLLSLFFLCMIVGCSQEPNECPECPQSLPVEEKVEMTFFDDQLFVDRMFKTDPEEPYGYDDRTILGTFLTENYEKIPEIYVFYPNGEILELYQDSASASISYVSVCKYIYRNGILTFDYGNNVKDEWKVRFENNNDTLIMSREVESERYQERRFMRLVLDTSQALGESSLNQIK